MITSDRANVKRNVSHPGIPQQEFFKREALVQNQGEIKEGANSLDDFTSISDKIQLFEASRHTPIVTPECFNARDCK